METHKLQLSHSDIMQGITKKETYIIGGIAYLKTKTGKELWFDTTGHLIHKIAPDYEEFRDYYEDGTLKHLLKVNQYEVFYNEKGLKTRKIKTNGIEEFWEYDNVGHLCRWYNTNGHERKYICDKSGTVIAWYGNEALLSWYNKTGRKLDASFAGLTKQ